MQKLDLTKKIKNIMEEAENKTDSKLLFVFTGVSPYMDVNEFSSMIVDQSTFDQEGNSNVFDRNWIAGMLGKFFSLLADRKSLVISYQQYSYLKNALQPEFFPREIVIIKDNIRALYPFERGLMPESDFEEIKSDENHEERSVLMPEYQADIYQDRNDYYYSLQNIDAENVITLFDETKEIAESEDNSESIEVIDVSSNPFAVDFFFNRCIKENDFTKKIIVKFSSKSMLDYDLNNIIERLNYILSQFGGGIYRMSDKKIDSHYVPTATATDLLHRYWGPAAQFRNLKVYENPEIDNKTISISQGQLVDTIIGEYKRGRRDEDPRDVFITAPTGAGKSLIFQIPSFYVAEKGDVTIVISPLKALMTDQVLNLKTQRNYNRVEYINSDLNYIDRERIIDSCKNGEIDILYLSPELLLSYDIRYFLGERKLGLMIIDEAHLITTWGRDFRVDYWFLGNHINKIRKYNGYKFPLVALTATAVYGGLNDMVFDSISSLYMHDPHKFIGEVRRDEIEFVINTHDAYKTNYDKKKYGETIDVVQKLHNYGLKSIVYAPYTKHVEELKKMSDAINNNMAVHYHGSMDRSAQHYSYQSFKDNVCKTMIATKAFGMGIDIPDIQVVYHHAPSGLLTDYVQEIGRAARIHGMKGFAATTYSESDLRYSRQLFGISSIKVYQLQEVLRKIIRLYEINGKKRNMLVSSNDFAYIFQHSEDIDQKVSTALMMLEKDYLIKNRFNVLIARPKRVFGTVYARTTLVGLNYLEQNFGDCFDVISYSNNKEYVYIALNLDKIWKEHFSDESFPAIKRKFYTGSFLRGIVELTPQLKVTISLSQECRVVLNMLKYYTDALIRIFSKFAAQGTYFTEKELLDELKPYNQYKNIDAKKIVKFILSVYSDMPYSTGTIEIDPFMQKRSFGIETKYKINNANYEGKLTQLLNLFGRLFNGSEEKPTPSAWRMISINSPLLQNYIRLGSFIDLLELGSFQTQGGEDPKLFIRLNDPAKIKKDSESKKYENLILSSVKTKHEVSCELFQFFFDHYFTNKERWDIIEDYFLGADNDEILTKYQGGTRNETDIADHIQKQIGSSTTTVQTQNTPTNVTSVSFNPKPNGYYTGSNYLTMQGMTKTIQTWITEDPVLLHQTLDKYEMVLSKDIYKMLMLRLQNHHKKYYRDCMRLEKMIDYKGKGELVKALIPYKNDPVGFYRWWRKNQNEITMNYKETLELLLKVDSQNPKSLIKEHRNMINK